MLRKSSLDCFGLGFFTSNTYFCKWCLPFFYSPASLMSQFGYSAGSSAKSSIGSNSCSSSSSPALNDMIPPKYRSFKLLSAAHKIPHPDKAYTGGEDACFMFEDSAIGVADGVGGWAEVGVDSSIYSNNLMSKSKQFFTLPQMQQSIDPATDSLQYGYEQSLNITGSSTGIIAAVVGNNIKICNVGDSRGLLLRPEGLKYKIQATTYEQTYRFNFPYQLGTGSTTIPKKHGQKYEWTLQDGDYLILGSDGLFDNLWNEDLADLLSSAGKDPDVSKLAQMISLKASEIAEDPYTTKTPWAVGAKKAGKSGAIWTGGKMDDITVVVSKVIGCSNPSLDAKL